MKQIYLIDGMSVVFRAHFAMIKSGLSNQKGEPTGAISGFATQLFNIIRQKKPDYIAVVFDVKEPTFRHHLYPEYKANREAFPEDLEIQMPKIKQLIDYLGVPQFELPGYEADDIIGTLAKKLGKDDNVVYCLTADKDYYQLVDDNIFLLKNDAYNYEPALVNIDYVKNKTGVEPSQIIDLMAIIGDTSDNVPGVKGVGEKTAVPLIQEYKNLENIYSNLDNITKESTKKKLAENKDLAFLSKQLVTIVTDVDIDIALNDLKLKTPDYTRLNSLLKSESMERLRERWFNSLNANEKQIVNEYVDTEYESHSETNTDYQLIDNSQGIVKLVEYLKNFNEFAIDLETSSLDIYTCDIVGISISAEPNKAFYIAVDNEEVIMLDLFTQKDKFQGLTKNEIIDKLKVLLENENIGKYGQNIKFDASILKRWGIDTKPIIFDSMLASYLLNPDEKHNMNDLAKKWLKYEPIPISVLIGEKKKEQKSMRDIEPEKIKNYACEDADIALQLKNAMLPELSKSNLINLANDIEFPLIKVLINIESAGVAIDRQVLKDLSHRVESEIELLKKKIFNEAGAEFNIDSPKQLAEILFEKMLIPAVQKTKTGFSTDVKVLSKLASEYEIAANLLEYRTLQKLKTTYIDVLPQLINVNTGRIHTTFNQAIAGTGRLTSTEPNLQNIPIKTKLGQEVRKAFIPQDENDFILSADYSQIELRIMAYISKDEKMIQSFKDGIDIHTATASVLFNKSSDEVLREERRAAKTVNFGIMYGLGSFGLSQRLNIEISKAKELINNYFEKYPNIKNYMDQTIQFTKENGFAETLYARRKYFNDINSKNFNLRSAAERAAINMPIQGTAADMMKIAMINIDKILVNNKMQSKMILQVHDELVFEVKQNEIELISEIVKEQMSKALTLGEVPVIVETGIGKNWFEAH